MEMELASDDFVAAEALFNRSLTNVPNVRLWTVYLDYIRRRNDVNDPSGQARVTVQRSYEFVLDNVGIDKDAGKLWQDYIDFIKFGPGKIGGSGWQDQQKMDLLRKAYTKALCIPISNINALWKDYDQFENSLNKATGRKFLAERSPAYMTAKSANTALDNIIRGLQRHTLPRLRPAPHFEGAEQYSEQVALWKKWIAWEKSDPLDTQPDEPETLRKRVLYCYKQALMALRFCPELWVDAAEWSFDNKVVENGKEMGLHFLMEGIAANPESVLLALKHAERIEVTYTVEEGDEAKINYGIAVRAPYDKILDTLYSRGNDIKKKEDAEIAQLEAARATVAGDSKPASDDDEEEDSTPAPQDSPVKAIEQQIALKKQAYSAQATLLSKALTFVWIALARAMRRVQGKGDPKKQIGGMRKIFLDARNKGRLGSEIYIAVAKMEWKCYNDKAGGKIFERGAKLFPEDPIFIIEYIKYMIAHGDNTSKWPCDF